MTRSEAIAALWGRAPVSEFVKKALVTVAEYDRCLMSDEIDCEMSKWARANGTDEELAAIGMKRNPHV